MSMARNSAPYLVLSYAYWRTRLSERSWRGGPMVVQVNKHPSPSLA